MLAFAVLTFALTAAPAAAQDYGEGYVPATRAGAGAVPMLDQDMAAAVTALVKSPDPGLTSELRNKFGRLVSLAGRWAPRLAPAGVGLAMLACEAAQSCWLWEAESDGQLPPGDRTHATKSCTIPMSWGPGSSMNCGGQTIVWPLARGLHGRAVHLLYSTRGGAGSWVEAIAPDQDLQTCASAALGRIPGWNYIIADTLTGCSPSPQYWITVNLVFGWKAAVTVPESVQLVPPDNRYPGPPPGWQPLPPQTEEYDWREEMARQLREAENDDLEQALLVEARTQRSIRIATERNPEVAPAKIAEGIRKCRALVPDATVGRDQCHNLPVLFSGADAAGARDHDADTLLERPDWVRLHRWKGTIKEDLGVPRDWYLTATGTPCTNYDGTVQNCDEYPFFSTREGYDKNRDGFPVAGWGTGNLQDPSLRLIPSQENAVQGSVLTAMYTYCGVASAGVDGTGGDPYLAIPLAHTSHTATFYLCNEDGSSK